MNTSEGASPEIRLRTTPLSMFGSYAGIFALGNAILAALIRRNPSEARSRAEHLEALNLDFDTWLDER